MKYKHFVKVLVPLGRWDQNAFCQLVDEEGNTYVNTIRKGDTGPLSEKVLVFETDCWDMKPRGSYSLGISQIKLLPSKAVFTIATETKPVSIPLLVGEAGIRSEHNCICYNLSSALGLEASEVEVPKNE